MGIRGVVFDLGHTLMHLDGTWPEIFERGAADLRTFLIEQGLDLDGDAFAQTLLDRRSEGFARARETMREVTAEDSMRWTFARFGLSEPEPPLVKGAIEAFFADEYGRWTADPEALDLLHKLSDRGLLLGMFSNATDDRFIQGLVDRLGFRPWLDPALSSAGTGVRKPDPVAFAPILKAWDLDPAEVVMVGDTLDADILGAQQAGMRSVWIPSREDARQGRGMYESGHLGPITPDMTIERLGELLGCLEQL